MKPESQVKETHYVDLEDIWVAYDHKWVLQSVYFSCGAGEIVGIVGPNGGGKSTLLKVILGLVRPDRGTVRLFGEKPGKRGLQEVGYLPQISQAERFFPVSALDVVLMGLYSRIGFFRRPDQKDRETAMEVLNRVGMADHAGRPFGALSGGQQQRVHIARALAPHPRLLVLDEPATGVDSVAQEDFYRLLAELRDAEGLSVLMVSHDIGVITAHADRIACLNVEIHYHGEAQACMIPENIARVFGRDLKVMVHDSRCATCFRRHSHE
mgnify:FL=1